MGKVPAAQCISGAFMLVFSRLDDIFNIMATAAFIAFLNIYSLLAGEYGSDYPIVTISQTEHHFKIQAWNTKRSSIYWMEESWNGIWWFQTLRATRGVSKDGFPLSFIVLKNTRPEAAFFRILTTPGS